MAKKSNKGLNPLVLTALAIFFLVSGWLMKSLPVFLLIGYAPLFALTDSLSDKKPFWNQFEYILVALGVSFFAAHIFATDQILISIIQAILMTLPFVAFGFVFQALGTRTIKFTIIFFWLALEYLLLKSPWRSDWIFLADGATLFMDWFTFTQQTGYLSVGLWILVSNLLAYQMVLKEGKFNITFVIAFVLWIGFPFVLKFFQDWQQISRMDMIEFYQGGSSTNAQYTNRGEWIARTAAWISVLIMMLSLVKYQIRKK